MKPGFLPVLAGALTLALVATAGAQSSVSVAVFRTGAKEAALKPLAEALDPVVLAELDKIEQVRVSARPPLDLHATQLALDCLGETSACLRSVAEQATAEALLSPSIERAGDETVVTLLYYDARGEGELKSVTRRHVGAAVERAALDAMPAMMRELFGIAEEPVPVEVAPAEPEAVPESDLVTPDAEAERPFPVAPLVVTAAGVAIVGVGVAFGLMAKAAESDYEESPVRDETEIDAAYEKLHDGENLALVANIGYGVGAAVIAVGAAMWIFTLSGDSEPQQGARLAPQLGPGQAGIVLSGQM